MDKIDFNEDEIIDALNRSGYLFESEIAKTLNEEGFFVETNSVIKDPITGKSREIDLIAEYYIPNTDYQTNECFSSAKYVIEIKNNSAPIVLLTELEHNPNIEDWDAIKEYISIPPDMEYYVSKYWDRFILEKKFSAFTQYCSFQKKNKNDELMALHPDNIYSGILKIAQYCEEKVSISHEPDNYLRSRLYVPILLISDDLYELKYQNLKPKLSKSNCSLLLYNYHHNDRRSMAFVFVVTKKGLMELLDFLKKTEREVFEDMTLKRKKDVT